MDFYEIDDPHAEAAAFRHAAPNRKPRHRKYKPSESDIVLKVRLDEKLFAELLEAATNDRRGVEGFVRRLVKNSLSRREAKKADGAVAG